MTGSLSRKVFFKLLAELSESHLEIVCPEDTYTFGLPNADLKAVVAIHDERFFKRALFGGDTGVGESYMQGDWSSPDLVSVVRMAVRNLDRIGNGNRVFSMLRSKIDTVGHYFRENSLPGSRRNISKHYDLGNDFYRLFLDRSMAYSCAYYQTPEDSLEQAQQQKFERICKKLRLQPSDHLLEIGTGWGGFALYAAQNYGCRVTTTTISSQQYDYARELFQNSGEAGKRITLLLEDYRKLRGQFDKLVSIEMFEAVGLKYYDTFFGACDCLLKPDGVMFLQAITMNEQKFPDYRKRCDWIQKYIFPGAQLASVAEILKSLGRCTTLSLHHGEDIGLHYAVTLKTWRERFLARIAEVKALGFDEIFVRMWEYYLAYCEGAFREAYVGEAQLLLKKEKALLDLSSNSVEYEGVEYRGDRPAKVVTDNESTVSRHIYT